MTEPHAAKPKFPATFWTANTIELFERAAYYAMASFMVIYLKETLGMSPQTATFLNGSILWGLIYFLPILSGTLADKFGFRRSLVAAMVLISAGYVAVYGGHLVPPGSVYALVVLGIVLIGMGGSIVKPCIAGTVQKTAGTRATLAFGIFYMVVNIGALTGRGIAYYVRTTLQKIPSIFIVSTVFAVLGLAVVLFLYREPEFVSDGRKDGQVVRKRTLGEAVMGIFTVLANIKFVFLIIVLAMFWFLYIQLYNLMPLYIRFVDPNAPMDLYMLANPAMIVLFQIPITRFVKRQTPVRSIMLGAIVVSLGMLINALPALLSADPAKKVSGLGLGLPLAGLFMLVSIASMAVGEMMASPRIYEYMGAIAPRGQEGLYLGYQSLPIALASIVGGPLGGRLFERYINTPLKEGRPVETLTMWFIIVGIGVASIIGLFIYNRIVVKDKKKEETA